MKTNKDLDFWTECGVCQARTKNHVGSTPCCGAISYMVDADGIRTNNSALLGSLSGGPIVPLLIPMK